MYHNKKCTNTGLLVGIFLAGGKGITTFRPEGIPFGEGDRPQSDCEGKTATGRTWVHKACKCSAIQII